MSDAKPTETTNKHHVKRTNAKFQTDHEEDKVRTVRVFTINVH